MPYVLSDDLTRAVGDYLNNLGDLGKLNMLKSWYFNEVTQQEKANVAKGLNPNGTEKPKEAALTPSAPVPAPASAKPMNRQERRKAHALAGKTNGAHPPKPEAATAAN